MNPKAKLWFVGHSDGSQLAQLGALKYALTIGVNAIGGVVLFGPSRVGSRGFATFYNTQLGERRPPVLQASPMTDHQSGTAGAALGLHWLSML
jgi:pimeloyl-ACP methyl ester carboxylesterase